MYLLDKAREINRLLLDFGVLLEEDLPEDLPGDLPKEDLPEE